MSKLGDILRRRAAKKEKVVIPTKQPKKIDVRKEVKRIEREGGSFELKKPTPTKRGGGGSSSSGRDEARSRAVAEAKAKAATIAAEKAKKSEAFKAAIKAARTAKESAQARREQERINRLKSEATRRGAITRTKILRDKKTGDRIQIKTTAVDRLDKGARTKFRIFETKNLDTGETSIKTFERDKKTKRTRQSGGITFKGEVKRQSLLRQGDIDKFKKKVELELKDSGQFEDTQKNRSKLSNTIDRFLEKNINGLDRQIIKQRNIANSAKQSFLNNRIIDAELRHIKRTGAGLALLGAAALKTVFDNAKGFNELRKAAPEIYNKLKKDPKKILKLPSKIRTGLKEEGKEIVTIFKISPIQAVGRIGGEFIAFKGTGKVLKAGGKISKTTFNKLANLDPRLLKIKAGVIDLSKKSKGLVLKVGSIKDIKESLSKQLRRAGKKVVAVSALADKIPARNIREFIKRERLVRKPLPIDEKILTAKTRALLKKFDKGEATTREILQLNKRLREESKKIAGGQVKGIDLLERSTFFDPDKVLRKSRLAIAEEATKEGTFFDLITGRATLFAKKAKPQVIVLEEFVENLPKTKEFKSIISKIKKNKAAGKDIGLTKKELAILTRFQVTPSGKLKPIGSTTFQGGLEREVTIAPGEIIKRVKKLGTLKVNGKRIPIFAVKIVKGKAKVKLIKKIEEINKKLKILLVKKTKSKTIKSKKAINKKILLEKKKLKKIKNKATSKDLKNFLKESRRKPKVKKKVFRARRKLTQAALRARRKPRPKVRIRPKGRARTKPRVKTKPKIRAKPRAAARAKPRPKVRTKPNGRARPRGTARARPKTPIKPIVRRRKKKKRRPKKKTKKEGGYDTFARPLKKRKGQKKPKLKKINKVPLSKSRARDLRNYIADTSLARTAQIRPTKGKPKSPKLKVPRGYAAKTKKKFREHKRVKGKRVPLPRGKVIEKRTRLLDTRQERNKITLSKRIKQLTKKPKVKKTKVKKIKKVKRVVRSSSKKRIIRKTTTKKRKIKRVKTSKKTIKRRTKKRK